MLLNYYRDPNFGDALNPLIFNTLLPNFFTEDNSIEFSGIGSIIGLEMHPEAKKRIIFSSGFAYGKIPKIDPSFDIVCVRGPLTAKALDIDEKLGIIDGAALLRELSFPQQEKKYKYSFMPHWESELKYTWKNLCKQADINYLSPTDDPSQTINAILQSEVVIAEAMHAAIVADTLRVPWIPVKAYQGINDFKWNDWTQTVNVKYNFAPLPSMYEVNDFVLKVIREKSKNKIPNFLAKPLAHLYTGYQNTFLESKAVKELQKIKELQPFLSDDFIFNSKVDQLLEKLDYVKRTYG